VGLVLPQSVDLAFQNPYYPKFVQGVGEVCREHGLMLLLVPPAAGLDSATIAEAAADGFIVVGLFAEREEVASLRARQVPIVLVDSDPIPDIPLIGVDERAAMSDLTQRVLARGHRALAVASIETGEAAGPSAWRGSMRHRWDGVRDGIERAGVDPGAVTVEVVEVSSSEAGGREAFRSLWFDTKRPTAVLAFSDAIAMGIIAAARAGGVAVPEELSVTGFDDLDIAAHSLPRLTTVRQPIVEKGILAARTLIAQLSGEPAEASPLLPAEVVERESVAFI
jgi:DNA-binding LacI/PurR family transcriptional regulator